MLDSVMEGYLETLASYINDEDKMVTYKWLSKELEIHVNIAKLILEKYWTKHKELANTEPLCATVMLIGHLKNGGMHVEVVREENLVAATEKYIKIISEHLYSLQKSLVDIQLLANTGNGDTQYGAIKCDKHEMYTDEEMFARRWGAHANFEEASVKQSAFVWDKKAEAKKKYALEILKPAEELTNNVNTNGKEDIDSNDKVDKGDVKDSKKLSPIKNINKTSGDKKGAKKGPIQSQTTGFKNLFGKVAAANQRRSPPSSHKPNHDDKNANDTKENKSNIDDKLKNGHCMDVEEEEGIQNHSATKLTSNGSNDTDNQKSDSFDKVSDGNKEKINGKTLNSTAANKFNNKKSSIKNRGNKRQRSQEPKDNAKKRKRIITVDSSEEDASDDDKDIFSDSLPLEEQPLVREISPSPPRVQQIGGKRKVRKAIDQTFQDEDGFFVTKKMFVYESVSEDETPTADIEEVKKSASDLKSSSLITKSKSSNKQMTLMSFFKKT